jgi:hypothetical protein
MRSAVFSIFFLVLLTLAGRSLAQQDTVVYIGVNGRLTTEDKADTQKEILFRSPSRFEIRTSQKSGDKWEGTLLEMVKKTGRDTYHLQYKAEKKKKVLTRNYELQPDGAYLFSEYDGNRLMRSGRTLVRFPLILDGETVDYYENGQVKSRSVFRDNELVSNRNWLENGENYIDSIFFSVDEEPTLAGGNIKLHQHVLQAYKNTGLDFSSVTGNLLLGFVVMETGEIKGIRVLKSLSPQINGIAVSAIQTLDGIWKPARLNGKPVRYFQLFPINFIHKAAVFDYMRFDGYLIYFDKSAW